MLLGIGIGGSSSGCLGVHVHVCSGLIVHVLQVAVQMADVQLQVSYQLLGKLDGTSCIAAALPEEIDDFGSQQFEMLKDPEF